MKTFTLFLLIGISTACSTQISKQTKKTHPLRFLNDPKLEAMRPVCKEFELDPSKDTILHINDRGSTLRIEANSFLMQDGSVVKEKVNLTIQEFTNVADIAFSGIPMTFKNGREDQYFNSSGMFEIQGKTKKENVIIDTEKPLTLDYSLTQNVVNTDFYKLKEDGTNWELIQEIPTIKEINAPIKFIESDARTINISFEDPSIYPEFKKYKDVSFRIDDNYALDTNDLNMVYYEIELKKTSVYGKYHLTVAGNKSPTEYITITYPVTPVFKNESFKNAVKEYEILFDQAEKEARNHMVKLEKKEKERIDLLTKENKEYEKQQIFEAKLQVELLKKQEENERIQQQNNALIPIRTMDPGHTYPAIVKGLSIASFGIYNCDQIYRIENLITIQANFVDENGKAINNPHVLSVIDMDKTSAFSFNPSNFSCARDGHIFLVLFTDQQEIYVLEKEADKWADLGSSGNMTLKMKNETKIIQNSDDLRKYLKV